MCKTNHGCFGPGDGYDEEGNPTVSDLSYSGANGEIEGVLPPKKRLPKYKTRLAEATVI
ncbi:MAG: hypothetical protein ABJM98_05390 [Ekhidna sp.]